MNVQDVITLAKVRLQNLVVCTNTEAMIGFINLGMEELYRKFNLSIKSETINTNCDLALYELRNDDVQLLIALYDKMGRGLEQSDVKGSMLYDYKLLNYRSFLLRRPFNGYLYAVYKASPVKLADVRDEIDLPEAMINALLTYIAYMANNTINRDNQREAMNQYQIFQQMCSELDMQGFRVPLNTESAAIQAKGFV